MSTARCGRHGLRRSVWMQQHATEPRAHAVQEFILNTPTNEASKFWIGGAANTARICAVFAQLTVGGQAQGPHVFVVHLRDAAGSFLPGVRCADNGPKQGLLGVDNGQIWLHGVRVPRDALLDRYAQVRRGAAQGAGGGAGGCCEACFCAGLQPRRRRGKHGALPAHTACLPSRPRPQVDAAGNYRSPISNPRQRFATMIGGLTTGRMLIAQVCGRQRRGGRCEACALRGMCGAGHRAATHPPLLAPLLPPGLQGAIDACKIGCGPHPLPAPRRPRCAGVTALPPPHTAPTPPPHRCTIAIRYSAGRPQVQPASRFARLTHASCLSLHRLSSATWPPSPPAPAPALPCPAPCPIHPAVWRAPHPVVHHPPAPPVCGPGHHLRLPRGHAAAQADRGAGKGRGG